MEDDWSLDVESMLLIEGVKDYGIFLLDCDGIVRSWNKGAERINGYQALEIIGRHFSTFYLDDDRERGHPQFELAEAVKNGSYHEEGLRVRKDGTTFWADVLISAIFGKDGKHRGFSKLTKDLSERKEWERALIEANERLDEAVRVRTAQLEAANQELESFSYSVSHDLRAPLRAIDGFSRILLEDFAANLDPEAVRHLETIRRNAGKMGRLIDDLLAFSRMTRRPTDLRAVDMSSLWRSIFEELTQDEPGEIEFAVGEIPEEEADGPMLRQAMLNLLRNAIKFSSLVENPRVEVGAIESDGKTVHFIKDNGAGFDMRYYDKLFNAFERLHKVSEFEGNGIGLALTRRIITRHGGNIWAESSPGNGASFYFTLRGGV